MRKPPPILRENRRFTKFPPVTPAPARNSAHLPSSQKPRAMAQFPSRRGSATSFPNEKIFGNLSKNPVNLSIFTEIFGNSISAGEATGAFIIPEPPEAARTATAGKCGEMPRWKTAPDSPERGRRKAGQPPRLHPNAPFPDTATAGKCALRAAFATGKNEGRRAASPAYPIDAKTRQRQLRGNACSLFPPKGSQSRPARGC